MNKLRDISGTDPLLILSLGADLITILPDPDYSGRTMAGLIGLIRGGTSKSEEIVAFILTGGIPAIFWLSN